MKTNIIVLNAEKYKHIMKNNLVSLTIPFLTTIRVPYIAGITSPLLFLSNGRLAFDYSPRKC
jgi:hypothetical protein